MSKVTTVGIDLAKNTFVLFGLGPKGHSGWKRKVRRKQLLLFPIGLPQSQQVIWVSFLKIFPVIRDVERRPT